MEDVLKKAKHIYCVGIGGIGVSALARKFLLERKKITGSDTNATSLTKELQGLGARIYNKHVARNITRDIDIVIYTKAIKDDNPELLQAKKLNIPVATYSQALGIISENKYTIAIAGSHGKTTTTGLIGWGLIQAKKDPTIIIGSLLKNIPTNFVAGRGNYFVVEACEYGKSFLDLTPRIAVVTNIDNDHLDYYKTKTNLIKAFIAFVRKIPRDGYLITNLKDPACMRVARAAQCRIVDYSKIIPPINTKLIGEHNAMNMRAAHAVLRAIHIPQGTIYKSISSFLGTARRMEYKGTTLGGVIIYDDYAHHPTEIRATLHAFHEQFPHKKIICVFQPHLYSRTRLLFKDFIKSLLVPDILLVLPIYAAREKKDSRISSQKLVRALISKRKNKVTRYAPTFDAVVKLVKQYDNKNTILITIGAGEAFKIGDTLLK